MITFPWGLNSFTFTSVTNTEVNGCRNFSKSGLLDFDDCHKEQSIDD